MQVVGYTGYTGSALKRGETKTAKGVSECDPNVIVAPSVYR